MGGMGGEGGSGGKMGAGMGASSKDNMRPWETRETAVEGRLPYGLFSTDQVIPKVEAGHGPDRGGDGGEDGRGDSFESDFSPIIAFEPRSPMSKVSAESGLQTTLLVSMHILICPGKGTFHTVYQLVKFYYVQCRRWHHCWYFQWCNAHALDHVPQPKAPTPVTPLAYRSPRQWKLRKSCLETSSLISASKRVV